MLYEDTNSNGVFDGTSSTDRRQTTAANGSYLLDNLPLTYFVKVYSQSVAPKLHQWL